MPSKDGPPERNVRDVHHVLRYRKAGGISFSYDVSTELQEWRRFCITFYTLLLIRMAGQWMMLGSEQSNVISTTYIAALHCVRSHYTSLYSIFPTAISKRLCGPFLRRSPKQRKLSLAPVNGGYHAFSPPFPTLYQWRRLPPTTPIGPDSRKSLKR